MKTKTKKKASAKEVAARRSAAMAARRSAAMPARSHPKIASIETSVSRSIQKLLVPALLQALPVALASGDKPPPVERSEKLDARAETAAGQPVSAIEQRLASIVIRARDLTPRLSRLNSRLGYVSGAQDATPKATPPVGSTYIEVLREIEDQIATAHLLMDEIEQNA